MKQSIGILTACLLVMAPAAIRAQPVVKVQAGTGIFTTGGVVITLKDMDLDNDGVINQLPGQGRFVFTGAANAVIAGASASQFDQLEIAKTGNQRITLQQHINIGTGIAFTSGNIDLNAHVIFLQPAASLMGESELSRITGTAGGYVQINSTLNAPAGANPGNLGIGITSAKNLGRVTIRRGHQSQQSASANSYSILRYFDLIPDNNTALQAGLTINYLDAELNTLDENQLIIAGSADSLHWANLGYNTRSTTGDYVEQKGIDNLVRFTLTGVSNPLPLIWESFNTQCLSDKVMVKWRTLQEQNTVFFTIRRSNNGIAWVDIGSVQAAGNSASALPYSFTDGQPLAGTGYYQIVLRDLDGRQTISPVLISRCEISEGVNVYPNPAHTTCTVNIQSVEAGTAMLQLYNNLGALMQQQLVTVQDGNNQYIVRLDHYPAGMYLLTVKTTNGPVRTLQLQKH